MLSLAKSLYIPTLFYSSDNFLDFKSFIWIDSFETPQVRKIHNHTNKISHMSLNESFSISFYF